jgi:hypothetical protein
LSQDCLIVGQIMVLHGYSPRFLPMKAAPNEKALLRRRSRPDLTEQQKPANGAKPPAKDRLCRAGPIYGFRHGNRVRPIWPPHA